MGLIALSCPCVKVFIGPLVLLCASEYISGFLKCWASAKKKKTFKLIGAFVFFSTPDGDAWLLELTEQDALVVAKKGNPTETVIEETEETLQINWTHSFAIKGTSFVTTSYLDKSVETHSKSPAQTISDAIQQVSPDYTNQKH